MAIFFHLQFGSPNQEILMFRKLETLLSLCMDFPGGAVVKNPPTVQETWVQSLGWKDPLEKGMTTHSSILAWRISWTD